MGKVRRPAEQLVRLHTSESLCQRSDGAGAGSTATHLESCVAAFCWNQGDPHHIIYAQVIVIHGFSLRMCISKQRSNDHV